MYCQERGPWYRFDIVLSVHLPFNFEQLCIESPDVGYIEVGGTRYHNVYRDLSLLANNGYCTRMLVHTRGRELVSQAHEHMHTCKRVCAHTPMRVCTRVRAFVRIAHVGVCACVRLCARACARVCTCAVPCVAQARALFAQGTHTGARARTRKHPHALHSAS